MIQPSTQTAPIPGQNNKPDVKAGPQPNEAEKKAQADKAAAQPKA